MARDTGDTDTILAMCQGVAEITRGYALKMVYFQQNIKWKSTKIPQNIIELAASIIKVLVILECIYRIYRMTKYDTLSLV